MPEDSDYEASTVAELREELESRGLSTSGHKDELVARLEEADAEATETPGAMAQAEEQAAEELPTANDPYKTVYNPLELPANTAAAQAFMAAHPDDVDPAAPISADRAAQATEAIQAHQDAMQEVVAGISSDPRLEEPGVPEQQRTGAK